MGSYMNLKNPMYMSVPENGNGELPVMNPLARQSSIYTMTFDEFQNTMPSKDFGSMNMEDLLKSIWTAEEGQALVSSSNGGMNQSVTPENLQRQGSLTLPRTLSQKTVDEVWRDAFKETNVGARDGVENGGSSLGQRELTFGETTLEEFLFRAGVVKEDKVLNASGVFGSLPMPSGNNSSFTIGFQQPLGNQLAEPTNPVLNSPRLGISSAEIANMNKFGTSQQTQPKLQPLFPKQTNMNFSSAAAKRANDDELFNPRTKVFMPDLRASPLNNTVVKGKTMVTSGLGNEVSVSGVSPNGQRNLNASSNNSSIDMLSPTPSPYNITSGDVGRGRRRTSASLEKVVERRRKRMIKNRESASRSRARKQAYMLELEAEIAKLKELNQGLRRKQEQFAEMQKNQILEKRNTPLGNKRICLRRTVTGPW